MLNVYIRGNPSVYVNCLVGTHSKRNSIILRQKLFGETVFYIRQVQFFGTLRANIQPCRTFRLIFGKVL